MFVNYRISNIRKKKIEVSIKDKILIVYFLQIFVSFS